MCDLVPSLLCYYNLLIQLLHFFICQHVSFEDMPFQTGLMRSPIPFDKIRFKIKFLWSNLLAWFLISLTCYFISPKRLVTLHWDSFTSRWILCWSLKLGSVFTQMLTFACDIRLWPVLKILKHFCDYWKHSKVVCVYCCTAQFSWETPQGKATQMIFLTAGFDHRIHITVGAWWEYAAIWKSLRIFCSQNFINLHRKLVKIESNVNKSWPFNLPALKPLL